MMKRSFVQLPAFAFFMLLWLLYPLYANSQVGVMIMAHGGSAQWNAAVEEAVAPLRDHAPVEIAFGMADRSTLQSAVERLERKGVTRIIAVGLFISAESFRHQTEYLLGLRADPPAQFIRHDWRAGSSSPQNHHSSRNADSVPLPIRSQAPIALSEEGLLQSHQVGEILAERVRALSVSPGRESVLILAHGADDDAENVRWLNRLEDRAERVRRTANFRAVKVETLREDWKEKRRVAEATIRRFVREGNQNNGRVIVVPFRLHGFGPYAEVLKGLDYVANGVGLLPHPEVTAWMRSQVFETARRAGWPDPRIN